LASSAAGDFAARIAADLRIQVHHHPAAKLPAIRRVLQFAAAAA
jgi:hypothetical protein